MLEQYIAILSAFGKVKSDENYIYHYHSWEIMVTTTVIAIMTKASRNTTKKRLLELERFGLVEKVHAQRNVTLWKLKTHKTYSDAISESFGKLTGEKKEDKEIKHLWSRP